MSRLAVVRWPLGPARPHDPLPWLFPCPHHRLHVSADVMTVTDVGRLALVFVAGCVIVVWQLAEDAMRTAGDMRRLTVEAKKWWQ
jgi:hypothetical protein